MTTHLTIPVDMNGNITSDAAVEGIIRSLERKGWTPGGEGGGASTALSGPGRPDKPETTGGVIVGSEPVGTTYTCTDDTPPEGLRVSRKVAEGVWHAVDATARWMVPASRVDATDGNSLFQQVDGAAGAITATLTPTAVSVTAMASAPEEFQPAAEGQPSTEIRVRADSGLGLEVLGYSVSGIATAYAPEYMSQVAPVGLKTGANDSTVTLRHLGFPASSVTMEAVFATLPGPWPLEVPYLGT